MPLAPHFDLAEAQAMVAISAHLEAVSIGDPPPKGEPEPVPLPIPIVPPVWEPVFQPETAIPPFDGYYEIWRDNSAPAGTTRLAVGFRGTQSDVASIVEDALVPMIPARGSIRVAPDRELEYVFARQTGAAVHAGFAGGLASMLTAGDGNGLIENLLRHVGPSDNQILITGHSQGASVATLFRSFIGYQPALFPIPEASYKTYVFAQAKPGNLVYAYDFETLASNDGMGIRVANTCDWVPQVPLTLQQLGDLNMPNPLTLLEAEHPVIAGVMRAVGAAETQLANELARIFDKVLRRVTGVDPGIEFVPTLDFASAGTPYILVGTPGTNPCDQPDADPPVIDTFWQHHANMYALLLKVPGNPGPSC